MGANLISPAVGHVTKRVKHLYKHLDPRYINVGEAAGGSLTGTYPNPGIANNAIGSGQIADNAVTSGKIADNAVTLAKMADNAVGSSEIVNGSVRYADLAVASWNFDSVAVANNTAGRVFASCPAAGQVAISGGAGWDVPGAGTVILLSRPSFDGAGDATSWRVDGHNSSGVTRQLVAHVLCITK